MAKVPEAWKEYRRRSLIAMVGLLGLPLATALAIGIKLLLRTDSMIPFYVLVLSWCGWWGWAAFRAARCPCPRCGARFLSNQEPWARRCGICGIALYANL